MTDAASFAAEPRSGVQVIARAAAILRAIGGDPAGLSLAETVAATGLAKSTVYRILVALEAEQLLESRRGRYRLGPALGGGRSAGNEALRRRARPCLERLATRVRETVYLGVASGDRVLFIDQLRWERELAAGVVIGTLYPLHSTASGKALLAQDEKLTERVLGAGLTRETANTITDPVALRRSLARARRAGGIAVDEEENHLGISGLATALSAQDGTAVSVGIPLPTVRYAERRAELRRELAAAGSELAAIL